MPRINLTTTRLQKLTLRKASSSEIEKTFESLDRYFPHKRWLPNCNRYRDDCLPRLRKDSAANRVRNSDLAKYIAASALPHALDGWGFFGRAIHAHLRGDIVSCKHLTYYSELRAAMALLATQGIGIFDQKHYVVEAGRTVSQIPRQESTHKLAWKALAHWLDLKRSSVLLEQILTPGGHAISDWQNGVFSQMGFRFVGRTWLEKWGLDIERCATDQYLRNEASYRPSHLSNASCLLVDSRTAFVKEVWYLCEPSGAELFQRLDRHLLRMWLRSQYRGVKNRDANASNPDYMREITDLLDQVNPQGLTRGQWKAFLSETDNHPDSSVISAARHDSGADSSTEHLEMLARGLMLLRLATGACRQLVINSGIDKAQLRFWWHSVGGALALWNRASEPAETQNLWLDIQKSIQDIEAWVTTGNINHMRSFRLDEAPALTIIDETERIALWGMAL